MSITITPDTLLGEVRLNIGDDDGSLLDDAVINAFLTIYDDNVRLTSLKCIDVIIADAAKLKDETTDEVSVKWSQIWEHYRQLKKDLISESGFALGGVFFGGTLKTENDKYYDNPNNVGCPVRVGDNTTIQENVRSLEDPYSFQ